MDQTLSKLCADAKELDRKLSHAGARFLSNEGRIFCNLVEYSGSCIKIMTSADGVSLRSATLAIDKFVNSGIAAKHQSHLDRRSFILSLGDCWFSDNGSLLVQEAA